MSIELLLKATPEDIRGALEKFRATKSKPRKGSLKDHFGKLKRGFDGLKYQQEARNEWN